MILIDKREKSKIPEILSKKAETKKVVLDIGDYAIIGPRTSVCISSKSAEDYIASIESDHLNDELIQMSANYDKCVLMVHGNIDVALKFRKLRRQIVFNYMAGVITRQSPFGLKATPSFINFTMSTKEGWKKDPYNKSIYDAVQFLLSMDKIISEDKIEREPSTKKYKVPKDKEQLYAIQYLFKPTNVIGEVRAKEIQKRFGSIKRIANATKDDFMKIEGIGEKIAEEMFNLLNEETDYGLSK
jgi:DNA excision repair protein ERCC-4